MDDMRLKFYSPVVTGTPGIAGRIPQTKDAQQQTGTSFQDLLKQQLDKSSTVSFSKHAVKRAAEHNIELSEEKLERLNRGVQLASEKNLDDTLILVGSAAFLVNIRNNTVITAVDSSDMKGNVFTNIDGAVVV